MDVVVATMKGEPDNIGRIREWDLRSGGEYYHTTVVANGWGWMGDGHVTGRHDFIPLPGMKTGEILVHDGSNLGVIGSYEKAFCSAQWEPQLVAYLHDDVRIDEQDWDLRVKAEFLDPTVGVVGFGGATGHGSLDIYKKPYHISQLGRANYYSNVDDAEFHGERFTGERDVAVLDGFCLIVRRELLEKMGGWQPHKWPPHHVYDYRVCLEAHRHGYKVRLVGVRCHHYGGRTATTSKYLDWCAGTKWGSDQEMHRAGHEMVYQEYRDVLPVRV